MAGTEFLKMGSLVHEKGEGEEAVRGIKVEKGERQARTTGYLSFGHKQVCNCIF